MSAADEPSSQATAIDQGNIRASTFSLPQLGHYELLGEIARGGMGVIYKAIDRQLDRVVALKLIKSGELADDDEIQRFQVEAKAAAQLDHPGIVPVHEVGQFGSQHFMAMAFIDGHSLWHEVKESPLAPKRAARLMQQVSEAVQYAHEHGIVHRDLKPHNILLTKDGQPKVTDFGLAKRQESDSNLTETGQLLGTPSYMPPEQAQGKVKQVGPLSDVYSLGATLYCLLTGRPPFQSATQFETMRQVVNQEPASPKSLNRAISVDLETICLRCLEKDPAKRYASAAALAQDLGRYLAGEPIQARPIGRLEHVLKWIARKPMSAAAYGLTALTGVLLAIGVTILLFWRNAETARSEADTARTQAIEAGQRTEIALQGEKAARAGEEQARQELERIKAYNQYVLNVRLAPTLWENGWVANAHQALDDCPKHLRHWEWKYLNRKMHPELAILPGHTKRINDIKLSPDGKLLATGRDGVLVWDTTDFRQVDRIDVVSNVSALSFSPDGMRLAIVGNLSGGTRPTVLVWDLQKHQQIAAFEPPHVVTSAVAFSPDGGRLAVGLRDGTLRLWNTMDFSEIPVTGKHLNGLSHLVFLPGGRLVTGCRDGVIKVWDSTTGSEQLPIQAHRNPALTKKARLGAANLMFLGCNPNGLELVSAVREGAVKHWEIETRRETASFRENNEVLAAAVSPDFRRVAFMTDRVKIDDARTGQPLIEFPVDRGLPLSVEFSPDNQRVACGWSDGYIRIWDNNDGKLLAKLTGHTNGVGVLRFNQDGSRLYSGDNSGGAIVWDLTAQPDVTEFSESLDQSVAAISPDGLWTAFVGNSHTILLKKLSAAGEMRSWVSHHGRISKLAFSPDSRTLASAGNDGTVRLWDVSSPLDPVVIGKHAGGINGFEFSSNGELLATAGNDQLIKVWNVKRNEELTSLKGHSGAVMNVVFSPGSDQLASFGQDSTTRLWSLSGKRELLKHEWKLPIAREFNWLLKFSPDGRKLAATHGKFLKVWDTDSAVETFAAEAQHMIVSMEFSPDNRHLVFCGYFPWIQIWDLHQKREVKRVTGGEYATLQYSPDGSRLTGAGEDQTIRLWDTTTWQEIATLTGHRMPAFLLQYDPVGKKLVSASHDGTARSWIAEEPDEVRMERLRLRPRLWRLGEAKRAEESQNWYAAAFHLDWLLKDQSEDGSLRTRYDHALAKLKGKDIILPP